MKREKTKSVNRNQLLTLGAVGLVLVLMAGAAVWSWSSGRNQVQPTSSPTPTKGNSTADEPSPSPSGEPGASPTTTPSAAPGTTPTPTPAAVAKPMLQKSSGNAPGSSVPKGAMMEFTCEGAQGLGCEVILTNKNNAAQVINLGKKTIASNGRGQYFAIWEWAAVTGSWNVVAKASNTAGAATSDAQTLEVRP